MAYRESGLAVMEMETEEGWEPENRFGEFAYRDPDSAESARLQKIARDEEERLRQDYQTIRRETTRVVRFDDALPEDTVVLTAGNEV